MVSKGACSLAIHNNNTQETPGKTAPARTPTKNLLLLYSAMTHSNLPASYTEMFAFLLRGSGIWAMIAVTAIALVYKSTLGQWYWWDVVIIALFFFGRGILEWAIHVWLYHAKPLPVLGWQLKSETSEQHKQHHQNPTDLSRLLITYKGVVALSCLVFFGSALLFQSINMAATMVLGLVVVGVMIEVVHLISHCNIPHKSASIKRLVWLHRHHHKKESDHFYGVSSSLGDRLFGTYPEDRIQ